MALARGATHVRQRGHTPGLDRGRAADDDEAVDDGLQLLSWLVDLQTVDDHLSVVPVAGRAQGDAEPGFDQQPIEVACLADACVWAFAVTGDWGWQLIVARCVSWFLGANDSATIMHDPDTGGGYDGLEVDGANQNEGAESTIAWLLTLQHGLALGARPDDLSRFVLNPTTASSDLVERTDVHIRPDPARVVTQLFVAGEELSSGSSRASPVMERVLAMGEEEGEALLASMVLEFQDRHPHLAADLLDHFNHIGDRLGLHSRSPWRGGCCWVPTPQASMPSRRSPCVTRRSFHTPIRAVSGPANCDSWSAFELSERGTSRRSSFVPAWRRDGHCRLDDPGRLATQRNNCRQRSIGTCSAAQLSHAGDPSEVVTLVLDRLPPTFSNHNSSSRSPPFTHRYSLARKHAQPSR